MTEERNLLYLHKMLHEQAKHKQGDLKDLQTEQVKNMQKLLCLLAIEDGFAGFVRSQNRAFLAEAPNTCPEEAEIEALKAAGITALCFPCIRIADNGKSAKGMWLAETADGLKPIAAEFLRWGAEWKLWKLILEPTTDNLPYEPYERCYPDPKEKPVEKPAFGGPGGPPPMGGPGGPGGPPPGGPGGPPPGGPGGPPPGMGGEAQSETEPAVTMLWSLADPDLAELHDNGDGTASVTATAAGTVRVYVDVVVDGVSAGRFTKIITVE